MVLHPIRFHLLCISGVHIEIWLFLPAQLNSVTHWLPYPNLFIRPNSVSLLSSIVVACCWVDFLLLILFQHVASTFPASFSTSSSSATTSCLCPGFTATSLTYFRPQSCCTWIGNAFALYTCVQCDHSVFLTPFGHCLADSYYSLCSVHFESVYTCTFMLVKHCLIVIQSRNHILLQSGPLIQPGCICGVNQLSQSARVSDSLITATVLIVSLHNIKPRLCPFSEQSHWQTGLCPVRRTSAGTTSQRHHHVWRHTVSTEPHGKTLTCKILPLGW